MTLVVWVLALSFAATMPQEQDEPPSGFFAYALADAVSKTQRPQRVDAFTNMVDVRVSGTTLTYAYESSRNASEAEMRQAFARDNLPNICADEGMRLILSNGIQLRYSYRLTAATTRPFVIEVTPADCGA
jgi:hypothetical protein